MRLPQPVRAGHAIVPGRAARTATHRTRSHRRVPPPCAGLIGYVVLHRCAYAAGTGDGFSRHQLCFRDPAAVGGSGPADHVAPCAPPSARSVSPPLGTARIHLPPAPPTFPQTTPT